MLAHPPLGFDPHLNHTNPKKMPGFIDERGAGLIIAEKPHN